MRDVKAGATTAATVLSVNNIEVIYDHVIPALLGANGAGRRSR